jgi:hypothetical protein
LELSQEKVVNSSDQTTGIIVNNGAILAIDGTVTLSGKGYAFLNGPQTLVEGVNGGKLVNLDNTIEGQGNLGGDTLTLVNDNLALIENTPQAQLLIHTGSNLFTNAGKVWGRQGLLTIADSQVANTGLIEAGNAGGQLTIQSRITQLLIGATVSLSGGGLVVLDGAQAAIVGQTSASALTNVDNRISGNGNLGGGMLTLVNETQGSISNGLNNTLTIDTGSGAFTNAGSVSAAGGTVLISNSNLSNTGTMEATGAGDQLNIVAETVTNTGTIDAAHGAVTLDHSTIDNAGGIIESISNGSSLVLNDATINGGTATIDIATAMDVVGGQSIIANAALTNGGAITIADGATLSVAGGGGLSGSEVTIMGAGALDVSGPVQEDIQFAAAATGKLSLDGAYGLNGTIFGFRQGDSIDVKNVLFADTSFSYAPNADNSGGTLDLHVHDALSGDRDLLFAFSGQYTLASFVEQSDNNGGTLITAATGASPPAALLAQFAAGDSQQAGGSHDAAIIADPMASSTSPNTGLVSPLT